MSAVSQRGALAFDEISSVCGLGVLLLKHKANGTF